MSLLDARIVGLPLPLPLRLALRWRLRWLADALVRSFTIAQPAFLDGFSSVWCHLSARLSVLEVWALAEPEPSGASPV